MLVIWLQVTEPSSTGTRHKKEFAHHITRTHRREMATGTWSKHQVMLTDWVPPFLTLSPILSPPSYFSSVALNVSFFLIACVRQGGRQQPRMPALEFSAPEGKGAASYRGDKDDSEQTISWLGTNIRSTVTSLKYTFYTPSRFVNLGECWT